MVRNELIISVFYPSIQPYIRELLLGDIGLAGGVIEIVDSQSGLLRSPNDHYRSCADRFKVILPYAGYAIKWDVSFNILEPQFPPDFGFPDEFLSDPEMDQIQANVPSLENWNYRDDYALLNVIKELFVLYKKYQVDLLLNYQRLQFEYNSLIGEACINADNVEVLVDGGSSSKKSRTIGSVVTFLIFLDVDCSSLPPWPNAVQNAGKDAALLRVTFSNADASRNSVEFMLSPNVESKLGKGNTIHLPPFTVNDCCLMDYVPQVVAMLQEKVAGIVSSFEKRKEFVMVLSQKLGKCILEYDSVLYSKLSFLLEHNDFHFLLHITIPDKFPQEKPVFLFQSVYHASSGKPFELIAEDFPYSPKWAANDMVTRVLRYLDDSVEAFQKDSVESAVLFK